MVTNNLLYPTNYYVRSRSLSTKERQLICGHNTNNKKPNNDFGTTGLKLRAYDGDDRPLCGWMGALGERGLHIPRWMLCSEGGHVPDEVIRGY